MPLVRVDKETARRIKEMKNKLEFDYNRFARSSKQRIKIPEGKIVKFAISPNFNENWIQLDLKKIAREVKKRK